KPASAPSSRSPGSPTPSSRCSGPPNTTACSTRSDSERSDQRHTRKKDHAMTMTRDEAIERLREIQAEIEEQLTEAKECIRAAGGTRNNGLIRAEAYWIAHIVCALRNDHGYLGSSQLTLEDTINELEQLEDDDDSSGSDESA